MKWSKIGLDIATWLVDENKIKISSIISFLCWLTSGCIFFSVSLKIGWKLLLTPTEFWINRAFNSEKLIVEKKKNKRRKKYDSIQQSKVEKGDLLVCLHSTTNVNSTFSFQDNIAPTNTHYSIDMLVIILYISNFGKIDSGKKLGTIHFNPT